jgi:hypothetical protein
MTVGLEGEFKITDRGNGDTVALVKVEYRAADDGTYVFVKWGGTGEWEEDPDALGFLLGEHGSVERL